MNGMSRLLTERERGLEHLGKGLGESSNSTRSSFSTACLTIVALLAICSVSICSPAQEQRLSQYAHRAWLVRDGFFTGSPNAITQTTDGYIWIGTGSGLFRFDGSRFEPWSSPDGKKLPSNSIYGLLGAHDGSLWIGMNGGLAHFVDHKLFVYPDFHDDVAGLLEDRSGNIWFTRSEAGGALELRFVRRCRHKSTAWTNPTGLLGSPAARSPWLKIHKVTSGCRRKVRSYAGSQVTSRAICPRSGRR